jgi:hypothetical protein
MKSTIAIMALLLASPAWAEEQLCCIPHAQGLVIQHFDAPHTYQTQNTGPYIPHASCFNSLGRDIPCPTISSELPKGLCFDPSTGKIMNDGISCKMEPVTWHLLTKSQGGTVSLIKGLTEKECKTVWEKLMSHCPNGPGTICLVGPSSIVSAECFE